MATVPINDSTPRVQYTATSSQTVFPYTFWIDADTSLVVLVDGVVKTISSDYTVSGVQNTSGGNVTFGVGLTAGQIVTIYRDVPINRISEFQEAGTFKASVLNYELSRLVAILQQIEDSANRALKLEQDSALTPANFKVTGTPTDAHTLVWDGATGNVGTGPSVADIADVAAIIDDVTAVADIAADVSAVADIDSNVTTVAGISSNVTTVAGISSNVTTVATNIADVNTAASNIAAIQAAPGYAQDAEDWASKTDGIVDSTDYSAKAWAVGGTGVTDTASAGAAKEWAINPEDDLVDGTDYSAKHYAAKAAASAAGAAGVIKITSNDTTAGLVNDKLLVDTALFAKTIGSPGGNETLTIGFKTLTANRLLVTNGSGVAGEGTLGSGLSLASGVLSATGYTDSDRDTSSSAQTTTSTSYTTVSGLSVSVTTTTASQKVEGYFGLTSHTIAASTVMLRVLRNSTVIWQGPSGGHNSGGSTSTFDGFCQVFEDSPGAAGTYTYTVQFSRQNAPNNSTAGTDAGTANAGCAIMAASSYNRTMAAKVVGA